MDPGAWAECPKVGKRNKKKKKSLREHLWTLMQLTGIICQVSPAPVTST